MKHLLLSILLLTTSGCFFKLADLRTDTVSTNPNQAKARELMAEMAEAHGVANWAKLETYTLTFEDEFYGFFGRQGSPFKDDNTRFSLNYIPQTSDGTLTFLTGKQVDETWGIQSGSTYSRRPDRPNETRWHKDKDIWFWLPTYQYFVEFPLRIQEANSVAYAGEQMVDGVDCEGVLASWNSTAPQKGVDQYLIWLDKETKRIVKLEYTVRGFYRFLTGAAYYKDYQNHDGILLPSHFPVESNLVKEGLLHEMRIVDFKANHVSKESLRPDPDLPVVEWGKVD